MEELIERLARAEIGATFNFYRDGDGAAARRERLRAYLEERRDALLLLVGEAPGYRGARVSGIPFTSERQLTGWGPSEASATIVHRVLKELELEESVLLWNVVPTHPGNASSNRPPRAAEIDAGLPFARELARGRRVVAVGRCAEAALGAPYVRHPSHGGAAEFRAGLLRFRPTEVLRKAVKGMLPRNRLSRAQIKKLKIYAGPEHPHEAQAPSELELTQ